MLKYFIQVTEDLIIPAILLGLLFAVLSHTFESRGKKILMAGTLVGSLAALVYSCLSNYTILTRRLNASMMYAWVFGFLLLFLLAALATFFLYQRNVKKGKDASLLGTLTCLFFTLIAAGSVFYALPSVLGYPVAISNAGNSIFSTDFLYRFIGWLFGLILAILAFASMCYLAGRIHPRSAFAVLCVVLGINAVQQISKILQPLHSKRIISGHGIFVFVRETSNHSDFFIYAILIAASVVPILLLLQSMRVNEPYDNPAQHRRIRAKWRDIRRWSGVSLVCFVLCVLCLTWFTALTNTEVELSPIEESEVRGDSVYVSWSQVEDGHLHRFAYTTAGGTEVRFIVIKKPNSQSYGIGLDACDICGETGYYERDGQVVCKLCDVVMNINTIGFKGGCNPIPIDYSVEQGYIIIPIAVLEEKEAEFA